MPNGALTIERVIEENFDDFLFLIEKLAGYERLDPPDEEAGMRLKRDGLAENPRYEAYLGRVDGKAAGYVVFFETYSSFLAMPTLYLEDIFILESHRRKMADLNNFPSCRIGVKSLNTIPSFGKSEMSRIDQPLVISDDYRFQSVSFRP